MIIKSALVVFFLRREFQQTAYVLHFGEFLASASFVSQSGTDAFSFLCSTQAYGPDIPAYDFQTTRCDLYMARLEEFLHLLCIGFQQICITIIYSPF